MKLSTSAQPPAAPDVLVVGGGTAALCAAISARRAGASVVLLEQAPRMQRGGNTRHSRNLRVVHEMSTAFSAGTYSAAEFEADLLRATGGRGDPALTQQLVQASAAIPEWLLAAGVRLQPTTSGVLPVSRKTVFLLGGGMFMLNALYDTAARLGVIIRYDAGVTALRFSDRHLEQAWVGQEVLRPRTAILCSGGAQADQAWLERSWGAAARGFINRGTPFAKATLLASMPRQGIMLTGDPGAAYLVAVDARYPNADGGIVTRIRCMPLGIVVDATGQRRHDESGDTASTRYALWGQRLATWPRQTGYLILDAAGMRDAPPSLYPPLLADSLDALAMRLQIPYAALAATLERYNTAIISAGDAPETWRTERLQPPKSRDARPITEPPFAAYPMRPGITWTYHGVAVDARLRVQRQDGGHIDNLFAAGMIMAPNLLPSGYLSGLAMTIGIVFGCLAGTGAADYARR